MEGTLVVRPFCAVLTENLDLFFNMDPYCILKANGQSDRTQVATNQGKFPRWTSIITFHIKAPYHLEVELYDRDIVSKDDYIGKANVDLNTVISKGFQNEWFCVIKKSKERGKLLLLMEFMPLLPSYTYLPQPYNIQTPLMHRSLTNTADLGSSSGYFAKEKRLQEEPKFKTRRSRYDK